METLIVVFSFLSLFSGGDFMDMFFNDNMLVPDTRRRGSFRSSSFKSSRSTYGSTRKSRSKNTPEYYDDDYDSFYPTSSFSRGSKHQIFQNYCEERTFDLVDVEDDYIQCSGHKFSQDEFLDWVEDKEESYLEEFESNNYTKYIPYFFILLIGIAIFVFR